ncbi:hypothetical protein L288_12900 [Sphingobium quisquiliarum P25]|uniref:Cell wall hydrolase SleB domain-containing protein n=2 Tax=Sphingobium quisquiliarum TaxID=538379 RepID=T0I6Q3_9SPHN|nr:hypothetical protein L288_12900 [Sphingobium quisquiliarum P25]
MGAMEPVPMDNRAGRWGAAILCAGVGAAVLATAMLWPQAPRRPAVQAKVAEAPAAIPRQYLALAAMTEQAGPVAQGARAREENERLGFAGGAVPAARPFHALAQAGEDHARALQCLTQAIYYEAATEPESGQRAVAQVVLNRVRHPAFAKTVCGVVYQRFDASVCQFSFVCDGSLARRPVASLWNRARRIAAGALAGAVERSVGTATHYHADYVFPGWAPHLAKLARIGAHIFYRWPGVWGLPPAFTGRYAGGEHVPAFDPASVTAAARPEIDYPPIAALPERRAANDLGGRMDPAKGWTLSIPDPPRDGGALGRMLAAQERGKDEVGERTGTVALAAGDHAMGEGQP